MRLQITIFLLIASIFPLLGREIHLKIQFMNIEDSNLDLKHNILIEPVYRETRHIPFLTYETSRGSHGMPGTPLPREEKKIRFETLIKKDSSAILEILNLSDSIPSLGGYKLKKILFEYEYQKTQSKQIEIEFPDKNEKDKLLEDKGLRIYHAFNKQSFFINKYPGFLKHLYIQIDCTDFVPIEMNKGDYYWGKHNYKYKEIKDNIYTYERNSETIKIQDKEYLSYIKQLKENKEYHFYFRIHNRQAEGFEYIILDKKEFLKFPTNNSPYISNSDWLTLKQKDLSKELNHINSEIIDADSEMDKYGYERVVHTKLVFKNEKTKARVFLIKAKTHTNFNGYYTVILD
ncbi:MAG: hypothetical protein H7A25_04385 [Leptospiraceae bacterium]|nr:hypothetical protein [Leptospiraceae bacterium]